MWTWDITAPGPSRLSVGHSRDGHRALNRNAKRLIADPCPWGLPEILTLARKRYGERLL